MRASARKLLKVAVASVAAALVSVATPAGAATEESTTVKVMVIGDGGPGGNTTFSYLPYLEAGVNAAADAIGKDGAVEFEVLVCDAQHDQNQATACARRAVDEGVAAVFSLVVTQAASIMPTLADAGIPTFWVSTGRGEDTQPNSMFPISASPSAWGGLGANSALNGFKRPMFYTSQLATASVNLAKQAYESNAPRGGRILDDVPVAVGTAGSGDVDLAPLAAAATAQDPDVVIMGQGGATQYSLIPALREAGYTGAIMIVDGSTPTGLNAPLDALPPDQTKKIFKSGPNPPFDAGKDSAAVKQFKAELEASGAELDDVISSYAYIMWTGMHATNDVIESVKTPVTAASLLDAFNSSDGIELPTGVVWVPSAVGPPGLERDSTAVSYFSKYIGDSTWKPVSPPGPKGLAMDAATFE